jgi:hypothetical protein
MKMAKASEADMQMASELANALEALSSRWGATMPEKIDRAAPDANEAFSVDDPDHCRRVCEYLIALTRSASLCRVVWGMDVLLDPRNKIVDPDADTLEHHPETVACRAATLPKPLADWDEDKGAVLWWRFPVEEPPYCGHPNCDDWPGYHTHWTPLIVPDAPAAAKTTQITEDTHA